MEILVGKKNTSLRLPCTSPFNYTIVTMYSCVNAGMGCREKKKLIKQSEFRNRVSGLFFQLRCSTNQLFSKNCSPPFPASGDVFSKTAFYVKFQKFSVFPTIWKKKETDSNWGAHCSCLEIHNSLIHCKMPSVLLFFLLPDMIKLTAF